MASALTRRILEETLDELPERSNANGECYGGEILDCMREPGHGLGAGSVELMLTRGVLVRAIEAEGAPDAEGVLQDYENRMPVSEALRYLRRALTSNSTSSATDRLES
jgi:hypothetical protein